jgi:hypothetical protein
MKVRVDFLPYDGDDAPDMESEYDFVEFRTLYAGSVHDWATAVWDFVGTNGHRWDRQQIIMEALLIEGGCRVDWQRFVGRMADGEKAKLMDALMNAPLASESE